MVVKKIMSVMSSNNNLDSNSKLITNHKNSAKKKKKLIINCENLFDMFHSCGVLRWLIQHPHEVRNHCADHPTFTESLLAYA